MHVYMAAITLFPKEIPRNLHYPHHEWVTKNPKPKNKHLAKKQERQEKKQEIHAPTQKSLNISNKILIN